MTVPAKAIINPNLKTMEELKSAREKRASLLKQMEDLHKQATSEKRNLTAEEEVKFDKLWDDSKVEERNIERLEKMQQIAYELRQPVNQDEPNGETKEEREQSYSTKVMLRAMLLGGKEKLSTEDRAIFEKEVERPTLRQNAKENRAQTVTTTGGGYLVPTILEDVLIKALKMYGGIRDIAKIIQTDGGFPLDMPTIDDTSNKGRLLGINTQVTETAFTFGKKTLYAFKFSSDEILIPTELLQDEKVDLNAYIADLLGERVGRIESDYFTTGTGAGSQPEGVQYAATAVSNVTLGITSASAVTKANLMDFMYQVDPAYRKSPKCAWMFNDATHKVIYKLSLGSNTDLPLFSGPLQSASNALPMANTMFGFPYVINQSMPNIGAGLKPILFGDFSRFIIRDVAGFRLLRLTERYADYDQIALILLHRADSALVTSTAIKSLTMGNT